jgi:glyoxylase-like metal-dependent hydrolase (beta-lactamase superfamily II)
MLHTPGHTPGSQCFVVDGRLVAGDTLFLDGCGRTDLPGGDAEALYHSVHDVLAPLPDDTILFPGHRYSPDASATLATVRDNNYVFRFATLQQWMVMFADN